MEENLIKERGSRKQTSRHQVSRLIRRRRFLKDLEERIFEDVVFPDICDIIHYHAQHNFPAYIDYVRNQIYQEKTYSTLMWGQLRFSNTPMASDGR